MESKIFIKHDVYALEDTLMMNLVFRYKELGYGVFWCVVERLTIEPSHRIPLDMLSMQVAMKLMSSQPDKVADACAYMVQIGLLKEDDGLVYSERVCRQCEEVERYRTKQSEIMTARWEKYRQTHEKPETPKREDKAEELLKMYHELCKSLPKVRTVTDARRTHCRTFMEAFKPELIEEGFRKAEESEFLRKGNGTWNGASFDWLINKSNFAKVLEGNYDNKTKSSICNDAKAFDKDDFGGFEL